MRGGEGNRDVEMEKEGWRMWIGKGGMEKEA
jgi:hypothetical protein